MIQWIRIVFFFLFFSGSVFLTKSWSEKHCFSSCYNFIFKTVFLGILGFMPEQRLGWEPPRHEVDTLAPNPPAAPIVYRIKFKLLRLELRTFSTWLQCTESSQHEMTFLAPFPLFMLSTGLRCLSLSPPALHPFHTWLRFLLHMTTAHTPWLPQMCRSKRKE